MTKLKSFLKKEIYKRLGWKTSRKIVVIESDEWRCIRMPSRKTYNKFLKLGIRVDKDDYWKFENLATTDELTSLLEVLSSVKDKNGRHPCLLQTP